MAAFLWDSEWERGGVWMIVKNWSGKVEQSLQGQGSEDRSDEGVDQQSILRPDV